MSTSLLYHAFGIRGYQDTRTDYQDGQTIFTIHQEPETCRCPACGSPKVQSRGHVQRRFRTVPIGRRATLVVLPIPRVECQDCGSSGGSCPRPVTRDTLDGSHGVHLNREAAVSGV